MEMTPRALWMSLRSRGVRFTVDGNRAHVDAPYGSMNEEEQRQLRAQKPELIEILRGCCGDCGTTLYQPASLAAGRCQRCRTA